MADNEDLQEAFKQQIPEPLELPETPPEPPLPPEIIQSIESVPVETKPEEEEEEKDELADLFEVPQPGDNDMETDDLFECTEKDIVGGRELSEEDEKAMADMVDVSYEDIMGEPEPEPEPEPPPKPKYKLVRRFKRTNKQYPPPPTSLGGVRY